MTIIAKSLLPLNLPQCEAIRSGKYANDTAETDKQCLHTAEFNINGKYLCKKHAQGYALVLLLNESK